MTDKGKIRKCHQDKPAILSKTRVCIKNLPPKTTERDLKEYLMSPGIDADIKLHITDCKILKNEKGKSRKFAFVGFRSAEQAEHAIRTFHRAFLNMSRITVEPAVPRKDSGENKDKKSILLVEKGEFLRNGGLSDSEDSAKTDQKAEEFLSLLGANTKKPKFWSNDDNDVDLSAEVQSSVTSALQQEEDDDDDDDHSSSSDTSGESSSDCSVTDNNETGEDYGDSDSCSKIRSDRHDKSNISDLEFLRSKQKLIEDLEDARTSRMEDDDRRLKVSRYADRVDHNIEDNGEKLRKSIAVNRMVDAKKISNVAEDSSGDLGKQSTTATATPFSDNRLFVRNLPFETTEEELEECFSPFGRLVECHIPVDDQRRNKGYAFVTYESPADATEALRQLDNVDFQGRLLHILHAQPPPTNDADLDPSALSWKRKQELARKEGEVKTAGKSSQGWSASFVRGDAVVDNLARRLGLRKGDVLGVTDDLSSGDAAVRLALGETHIIDENREFFREHGVNMDVLVSANASSEDEQLVKRSKTAMLVKNLPFDTRLEDLTKLFHVGDVPVEVLLAPSRTIALVEFKHSADAKRAFRKLAYRRFKHVPIYLEWAPLQAWTLSQERSLNSLEGDAVESKALQMNVPEDPMMGEEENFEISSEIVTSTLYVKNLNFGTNEETLRNVFEKEIGSRVISVRIPRKVAPTKRGASMEARSLPMGYGFVELTSLEVARHAVNTLQGKLVDGHAIELAISAKECPETARKSQPTFAGKNIPTKIMVRNVPFQATRRELLNLFGTFGQLRKVRLPQKIDGNHRGFAFVEFLTGKEALAAMSGLSQTHLYGRHLVLEWALDESDDQVNVRDKAKRDSVGISSERHNKKIRFVQ